MQRLTKKLAKYFLKHGCNPTCHVCYGTLFIDQKFDLVELGTVQGVPGVVRGTVCEECIRTERRPTPGEIETAMQQRWNRFQAAAEKAERTGTTRDESVAPNNGCFFTADGRPF